MSEKVKLVKLNKEQIVLAKNTNGERKKITHAVVCGKYGQLFGTEKQCRKYFSAWSEIFPKLFNGGEEVENFDIKDYQTTQELVMVLINANDSLFLSGLQKFECCSTSIQIVLFFSITFAKSSS